MNFVAGPVANRAVATIMPAGTPAVLILAAGAFEGTSKRMAPLVTFSSRAASLKLKIVFSPSRVTVRSAKVNSARDSVPVRTAVPRPTFSFTAAGRGAAFEGSSRTSRITAETRADLKGAPSDNGPAARKQTKSKTPSRAFDAPRANIRNILFIVAIQPESGSVLSWELGLALVNQEPRLSHSWHPLLPT